MAWLRESRGVHFPGLFALMGGGAYRPPDSYFLLHIHPYGSGASLNAIDMLHLNSISMETSSPPDHLQYCCYCHRICHVSQQPLQKCPLWLRQLCLKRQLDTQPRCAISGYGYPSRDVCTRKCVLHITRRLPNNFSIEWQKEKKKCTRSTWLKTGRQTISLHQKKEICRKAVEPHSENFFFNGGWS